MVSIGCFFPVLYWQTWHPKTKDHWKLCGTLESITQKPKQMMCYWASNRNYQVREQVRWLRWSYTSSPAANSTKSSERLTQVLGTWTSTKTPISAGCANIAIRLVSCCDSKWTVDCNHYWNYNQSEVSFQCHLILHAMVWAWSRGLVPSSCCSYDFQSSRCFQGPRVQRLVWVSYWDHTGIDSKENYFKIYN